MAAWALAPWMALDSLVMVYLVGVVVVAVRYGRGPSILAAVAGSVAFDFLFTFPFFSFRIADPRLVITVGVMLLVGLVISELTSALRERGDAALDHARQVAVLYSLTRNLARAGEDAHIYRTAGRHIARAVGHDVLFFRGIGSMAPELVDFGAGNAGLDRHAIEISQWVFHHRRRAGAGTTQHPEAEAIYLPLAAAERALGVMMVRPRSPGSRLRGTQTRFLGHCARQVAAALERERLVRAAHAAALAAEEEQMRNALLASVSHDLRQPLNVIEAAASSLLDGPDAPTNPIFLERIGFLVAETRQMSDTVNKILDMIRLESTPVHLDRQWYPLETLILGAINRVRDRLSEHVVRPAIPNDVIWVYADVLLFEKLFTNLLENAAKYSETGSHIGVSAARLGNAIEIRVTDEGHGLPPGDTDAVFGKFHRGKHQNTVPGIGLGLSICRAIVGLHGGHITAHRRPEVGSEFVVTLPISRGEPTAQDVLDIAGASRQEITVGAPAAN